MGRFNLVVSGNVWGLDAVLKIKAALSSFLSLCVSGCAFNDICRTQKYTLELEVTFKILRRTLCHIFYPKHKEEEKMNGKLSTCCP